jgi:hypothetical protein
MRVFIRQSVFETNSSSSHATNIEPAESSNIDFSSFVMRNGEIVVEMRYFGSESKRYRKFSNKLAYVVSEVASIVFRDELPKEGSDATKEILTHPDGKLIADVIKEVTGCNLKIIAPEYCYYLSGARSQNGDDAYTCTESMKRLLFSEGSYVQTGSDEPFEGVFINTDTGFNELYYADHFTTEAAGDVEFKLVINNRLNEFGLVSENLEIEAHVEDNLRKIDFYSKLDGITATSVKLIDANKHENDRDEYLAQRMAHIMIAHIRYGLRYRKEKSIFNILEAASFSTEGESMRYYAEAGKIEFSCVANREVLEALEQEFLDLCSLKNGMAL